MDTPNDLVQHLTVSAADNGKRLDNLLARQARQLPKGLICKLVRKGNVRLDKKRAKPSTRVAAGQIVRLPPEFTASIPRRLPPAEQVEAIGAAIVHSDEALIIVNKPVGIPAHAGSKYPWGVVELIQALMCYDRADSQANANTAQQFPQLVHRIDRLTSGLLLMARHSESLQQLQGEWRNRTVAKTYMAVVHKHLTKTQTLEMPLAVTEQYGNKRAVVDNRNGKPAVTIVKPVKYGQIADVPVTLVECTPLTGKTHQIRVHCQSMGHPVVGDPLYQNKTQHRWSENNLGETLLLHAASLEFKYFEKNYAFSAAGIERLTAQFVESTAR